jgi:hypothetical protein
MSVGVDCETGRNAGTNCQASGETPYRPWNPRAWANHQVKGAELMRPHNWETGKHGRQMSTNVGLPGSEHRFAFSRHGGCEGVRNLHVA